MEENPNLLDEFVPKESEIMIYQRKYAVFRKLGLLVGGYALTTFMIIMLLIAGFDINGDVFRFLLIAMLFILFITIVSAFLGFIIAVFIDRKYPYRQRYAKAFWIVWFLISSVYAVFLSIKTFDYLPALKNI